MPSDLNAKMNDVGMYVEEDNTMNQINGIVTGQYGVAISIPIVDADGNAKDLSAFTAVVVKAIAPDYQTTLSFTGTITSSTGGLIAITPSSGNTFTRDGTWEGQAQFSDTGVYAPTVPFQFIVEKQL